MSGLAGLLLLLLLLGFGGSSCTMLAYHHRPFKCMEIRCQEGCDLIYGLDIHCEDVNGDPCPLYGDW